MKSRLSSKGQVTVPAKIRARLGLRPGTAVVFELRENGALIRKGTSGPHPADQVFGTLKLRRPVDELLDEMRGPGPADEDRGFYRRHFIKLKIIDPTTSP